MPTAKLPLPSPPASPPARGHRRCRPSLPTAPGREGEPRSSLARSQGDGPGSEAEASPLPPPTPHPPGPRLVRLLTDDDAQVLEAGQRVLLGVQYLLGGLLHVPVRLLREHPAAAAAPPGRVPPAERRRWAGKRLSRGASCAPLPRGPRCQARLAPPPPPLHGTCGSGSNMADPPRALQRRGDAERGPPPRPRPGPHSRGDGALRRGATPRFPEAPLRLKLLLQLQPRRGPNPVVWGWSFTTLPSVANGPPGNRLLTSSARDVMLACAHACRYS